MITKDILASIGTYILEGMTEQEACTLSGYFFADLQDDKEDIVNGDIVSLFLEKKHTEFKHNHLKEIQKNKSEKNSQWILEKLRPEEFGPKSKSEVPVNVLSVIIKQIQNDSDQIIKFNRGEREVKEREAKVVGVKLLND